MDQADLLLIVFSVGAVIFIAYFYLVNRLNAKNSKWGINFKALKPGTKMECPGCGSDLPKIRKPANVKQFLWGGFTCKSCGKEYDKWLKQIHS